MFTVKIKNGAFEQTIHDGSAHDISAPKIAGGKIAKAVNSNDSFSFTIYPNNAGYKALNPLRTSVTVIDKLTDKAVFIGRVLKAPETMDESGLVCRSVTCEGRLGWLYDSVQPYMEYKQLAPETILRYFLSRHNAQVGEDKRIELGAVTVTSTLGYAYSVNWVSTMAAIEDKLIGKFGGEIQLRDKDGKVYLDYLTEVGHGTDAKIELAVNLRSITKEVDETSVITRLYPLGAKSEDSEARLTIGSVNGGRDYIDDEALIAKYGVICGTQTWDDVTLASNLMTKGKAYMQSVNRAKKQYKISALDLSRIDMSFEQFELGCRYRVVNPLMDINEDLRIIKIVIDLDSPHLSELTFGDKFATMTGFVSQKTQSLQSAIDESSFNNRQIIDSKIDNATKLITGAEGGHVILDPPTKPSRILIMDTEDIDTCTACIQLNKNGLGFWRAADGGSAKAGPYTNAWTIDGNLVASFITALTLTGLKINNGSGTFKVDEYGRVTAKALDMQGGSINVQTSDQSTDVIKLSHNEWTMEISPLQIKITNSTVGGYVLMQAGAINGYWNDELKFNLSTNSGDISTYTDGEKRVAYLDTNNRSLSMYNADGDRTVLIEGESGNIWANAFAYNT